MAVVKDAHLKYVDFRWTNCDNKRWKLHAELLIIVQLEAVDLLLIVISGSTVVTNDCNVINE